MADDAEVFDKYTFALMHLNRVNNPNEMPPLWALNDNEEVRIKSSLYMQKPNCGTLFAWGKSVKDPKDEMKAWQAKHDANPDEFDFVWQGSHGWKFDQENPSKITHNGLDDGKPMMRSGKAGFYYKLLTYLGKRGGLLAADQDIVKPLPKPSGTKMREMMAAYFAVAGGIFISYSVLVPVVEEVTVIVASEEGPAISSFTLYVTTSVVEVEESSPASGAV